MIFEVDKASIFREIVCTSQLKSLKEMFDLPSSLIVNKSKNVDKGIMLNFKKANMWNMLVMTCHFSI